MVVDAPLSLLAGVLFALELLAIGNLVSNSILKVWCAKRVWIIVYVLIAWLRRQSDSVVTFGVWFGLGGLALVVLRFLVDYVIIPQEAVDKYVG